MVRRHPVVLLGHRVHLHEDAADGVVSSGTEVLIALALEPVRGDVAVGSVQAAPHLVLLPAEAEEAASGGGVGSRKAVAAHPHPERQIVSPADDSVPVLGNHPHAAQVVTQEVLHPGARCTSVPLDENVVSFHSLKSLLSGFFLQRASILDFKARLGNRCRVFPIYPLLRASILDFRPRLANRCRVFPVYGPLRASILDFRARLANRCSTIVATTMNGPPATAVATTRSVSDPILRYLKEE